MAWPHGESVLPDVAEIPKDEGWKKIFQAKLLCASLRLPEIVPETPLCPVQLDADSKLRTSLGVRTISDSAS
jgi:hypothetical protein